MAKRFINAELKMPSYSVGPSRTASLAKFKLLKTTKYRIKVNVHTILIILKAGNSYWELSACTSAAFSVLGEHIKWWRNKLEQLGRAVIVI